MDTEGVNSEGGNPQRSTTGDVNGNSMQANVTRIDGASNSYMWLPLNTAYVPPAESIESVSIVTNSFGLTNTPHYGNPGTDVTNTATFGVILGTLNLAGRGSGTGGERVTTFAARLMF